MLVLSWGSITVSTVVLGLRLFQLRPMMRTLGFSYDAPEARKEDNKTLAKKALALDRSSVLQRRSQKIFCRRP